MRRDGSLLKRYCAGEFDQVWREIRSHVRIEGEFRDEVMEIAEATMRRVAQNADLITERLQAVGWPALSSEHQDLRTPRGGRRPSCGWPIPVWCLVEVHGISGNRSTLWSAAAQGKVPLRWRYVC